MQSVRIINEKNETKSFYDITEKIGIEIKYTVLVENYAPVPNIHITDRYGEYAFLAISEWRPELSAVGDHTCIAWIPSNILNVEFYVIGIAICTYTNPMVVHFFEKNLLSFETLEDMNTRRNDFKNNYYGLVRPSLSWEHINSIL
jgi:hypothetical protein